MYMGETQEQVTQRGDLESGLEHHLQLKQKSRVWGRQVMGK